MGVQEVFAANVRRFRRAAGLTQEALAEKSGLHRTAIGRIEQGRENVTLKTVSALADALEVDPAILFLDGLDRPKAGARGKASCITRPEYVYALVHWDEKGVEAQPLEVKRPDLTVQVLLDLLARGLKGADLADAYRARCAEIARFLDGAYDADSAEPERGNNP